MNYVTLYTDAAMSALAKFKSKKTKKKIKAQAMLNLRKMVRNVEEIGKEDCLFFSALDLAKSELGVDEEKGLPGSLIRRNIENLKKQHGVDYVIVSRLNVLTFDDQNRCLERFSEFGIPIIEDRLCRFACVNRKILERLNQLLGRKEMILALLGDTGTSANDSEDVRFKYSWKYAVFSVENMLEFTKKFNGRTLNQMLNGIRRKYRKKYQQRINNAYNSFVHRLWILPEEEDPLLLVHVARELRTTRMKLIRVLGYRRNAKWAKVLDIKLIKLITAVFC